MTFKKLTCGLLISLMAVGTFSYATDTGAQSYHPEDMQTIFISLENVQLPEEHEVGKSLSIDTKFFDAKGNSHGLSIYFTKQYGDFDKNQFWKMSLKTYDEYNILTKNNPEGCIFFGDNKKVDSAMFDGKSSNLTIKLEIAAGQEEALKIDLILKRAVEENGNINYLSLGEKFVGLVINSGMSKAEYDQVSIHYETGY